MIVPGTENVPALKGAATPPALTDALTSAATYAQAEKADATRRAYAADWRHFQAWGEGVNAVVLPAAVTTVAAYLAHLADRGRSASTIARRVAAIAYAHKLKGLEPPTSAEPVRAVLRGIRRTLGTKVNRKAPATDRAIAAMIEELPATLAGKRDRALLLIGFAAALRRSELVDLDVNDLALQAEGLVVHVGRSKTDQEGAGAEIAVPRGARLKPVEALEGWLKAAGISTGPVFRTIDRHGNIGAEALSDRAVALIVKRHATRAGLDPALFAGHSLRAGFVTSALEHGADLFKVMDVTRHRRVETLRGYDRRAKAFRDHAGERFL